MSDLTGSTLGQYIITERLGRGGMADVYKAFHPGLAVYRAIKVIRSEFVTTQDFRLRFQKEARAVAALRHPNIVQIHDFGSQDENFYMVMEFIAGRDLKKILRVEGKIRPISRAIGIAEQVASALQYAHSRELIHRDIKPDNVMLTKDGHVILTDFGIAKLLSADTQLTRTGLGIGTPTYMAPEQAQALREPGPETDIYSLSIVLYELLTGQVPFSADTPLAVIVKAINDPLPLPRKISPDISERLEQIILKGTNKDADNRYPSASEFQNALKDADKLESKNNPEAPPTTGLKRNNPDPQSGLGTTRVMTQTTSTLNKKSLYFTAAVVVLVLAGAGLYFQLKSTQQPTQPIAQSSAPKLPESEPATSSLIPAERSPMQASNPLDNSKIILDVNGDPTKAGKHLRYEIEGEEGQVLYFDLRSASATTDFALTTPDGRKQFFESTDDHGPVVLEQTGTHVLFAKTRNNKTAELDFALWRIDPPSKKQGPLPFDQFTQAHTSAPGQTITYTLEGRSGQSIFFDLAKTSTTTDFSLTAPDGRTQVFGSTNDTGPITLKQNGQYLFTADPRNDKLTEFDFAIWNIEPSSIKVENFEVGQYYQNETTIPGQTVQFPVTVEAGQTVYFDFDTASNTTDFSLLAPDNRTQVFEGTGDFGPVTLKQKGSYVLTANPRYDKTSQFGFTLWHVDPPVKTDPPLLFNQYTKGGTEIPGQTLSYELTSTGEMTIFFDMISASETTDFVLLAPDGRTKIFDTTSDTKPIKLEQDGNYVLTANPRYDKTSQFEFTLWHIDPPIKIVGLLKLSEFTQGSTEIPGQIVLYEFTSTPGVTLFFDMISATETTDFVLVAPDGRTKIFNTTADTDPIQLEQEGRYVLTADPRYDKKSEYEFNLWQIDPATLESGDIKLGTYMTGQTTIPGQVVTYNFENKEPQLIEFKTGKVTETTDFILMAPDGRSKIFNTTHESKPVKLKQTGTYVLTANPRYDAVSKFEFIIK